MGPVVRLQRGARHRIGAWACLTRIADAACKRRATSAPGNQVEYATLGWNVVGTVVVIAAALAAGSVALAGFGLDSMIEIGASTVVIWQLKDPAAVERERRALRLIGVAFIAVSFYIAAQAAYTLIAASHPGHSSLGFAWTAATCAVMLALAAAKSQTGGALGNRTLQTESRVT